jgi:hypothetical protein
VALLLLKKKPVEKTEEQKELLSAFAKTIDEVGKLQVEAAPVLSQIKALQAKLAPLAAAWAKLQAYADALNLPDDPEYHAEIGAEFIAEIGAKGRSRSVKDKIKLIEMLGEEMFLQLAEVKLGDIDKYLTQPQRDEVLKTERTKRSVKVIRRVA